MLSDNDLTDFSYEVASRYEKINVTLIKAMAEQIKEIGRLTPSNVNRLEQMIKYNQNIDKITYLLAQESGKSLSDIMDIYEQSGKGIYDNMLYMYKYRQLEPVPFSENIAMQTYLNGMRTLTANTFVNLASTSVIFESYRQLVDIAVQAITSGVSSYTDYIREAITSPPLGHTLIKDAWEGMRVQYSSGYTRRLDSAVRMNILDGVKQVNNATREQVGKEVGADGIEITAHALCAKDHLPIQGRQFTKEKFAEINSQLKRKISTCNCKHYTFPIILGLSPKTYTSEELDKYKELSNREVDIDGKKYSRYDVTQIQRNIETEIRRQKERYIFSSGIDDKITMQKAENRILLLSKKYKSVSSQANLAQRVNRLYVPGYKGKKSHISKKNTHS
jgi:hypothetical protein